jgi:hypothetical protein
MGVFLDLSEDYCPLALSMVMLLVGVCFRRLKLVFVFKFFESDPLVEAILLPSTFLRWIA